MHDIEAYIAEATRVRRTIQIYSEFFDSQEPLDTLNNLSVEVTAVIRRSLHDEIIISLARLFDSDSYMFKKNKLEYLSQRNLSEKNITFIKPELKKLRDKTSELWNDISIKEYRNLKVAHNDKSTITGNTPAKHNISYDKAVELVDTSIILMIKLMASISGKANVEVWVNINDKKIGGGNIFISKLRAIQK